MFGDIDIESNDLVNVFMVSFSMLRHTSRDHCPCLLIYEQIFIKNKDALAGLASSPLVSLLAVPARLIGRMSAAVIRATGLTSVVLNDARRNISAHYDLGNGMFEGESSSTYRRSFRGIDGDLSRFSFERHDLFMCHLPNP